MKKIVTIVLLLSLLSTCFITTVTAAAPPGSTTVKLKNVEKLIHFIQTVDVDNLQNGAYKNGISSLRAKGEVLVPSYPEGMMESGMVEVLQDYKSPDGYTCMSYAFYSTLPTILIYIKEVNPVYEHLIDEGLISYLTAQYGGGSYDKTVYETTIGGDRAEKISYVMLSTGTAKFIKDGFEVQFTVNSPEYWDIKYLNDLCLDIVPLENGEGSPAPSQSPSPSPEVSPSTVPSVQPSPSAESVKTPVAIPNGGIFTSTQMITLTCETSGATIYYTTDGTAPTTNSTVYISPFMIFDTTTIKAIAVKEDMADSAVMTASFTKYIGTGGGGGGEGTTSYTVKFETNGGSAIADKTVDKGDKITKPASPTKEGYTFAGWYSDKELTQEYDFGKDVTGNITLYAKWIENENVPTPSPSTEPGWQNPFSDINSNDWFYSDVEYVYTNNLFKGITETEFEPNVTMTRGMLVTVLWRMQDSPAAENQNPFGDVPDNVYYTDAVKWAAENGLVNGMSNNLFNPEAEITRQDIAVILLRYLDYINADYVITEEYRIFADEAEIADYAKNAVQVMNKLGIINGKGNNMIDPQGKATRAEVAAMLRRIQKL